MSEESENSKGENTVASDKTYRHPTKQRKKSKSNLQSTGAHWECLICNDVLGEDEGLVPCIIISCRPYVHSICLSCRYQLLDSAEEEEEQVLCPKCRKPVSEIIPCADLIAENDHQAHEQLRKYHDGSPTSIVSEAISGALIRLDQLDEKIKKRKDALIAERLKMLTAGVEDEILDQSNSLSRGISVWWNYIPEFEENLTLNSRPIDETTTTTTPTTKKSTRRKFAFFGRKKQTDKQIKDGNVSDESRSESDSESETEFDKYERQMGRLERISSELQPHIDKIYQNSPYRVIMKPVQEVNGRPVYMSHTINLSDG